RARRVAGLGLSQDLFRALERRAESHGLCDQLRFVEDFPRNLWIARAQRLRELQPRRDEEIWNADGRLIDPVAASNERLRRLEHVRPQRRRAREIEPA